jgi:colicin import membrane protein
VAVAGSAANAHELLLPPPGGGLVRGAALALLAHALLFVALTSAVQWRTSPPEAVTAELWAAVPQVAAPRAVETPAPPPPPPAPALPKVEPKPEPAPPDPQIAIAKAEKERAERLQREKALQEQERQAKKEREAEALKREQAEAKKRDQLKAEQLAKQKADDERLAKLREDNLKRMMGQAGATGGPESTGTAARDAGPSKSYAGKLVATIKPNIVFTDTISGNPAAEVEVSAAPSGTILARRLVRSSGHKDWDDAVLRAIDRTGTLPRDTDGRVPPRIIVAFRPQE